MSRTTWSNLLPPHHPEPSRHQPRTHLHARRRCGGPDPGVSRRMSMGNPGAFFPFRARRCGGRSGQQTSAAPHAPPRSFLRVARLPTRRQPPALTKGRTRSASLGRLELSELLPHPPGAVSPDVALRSARSSPPLHPAAAGGEEGGATLRSCAPAVHAWHGRSDPWIHLSTQDKVRSIQKIEGEGKKKKERKIKK